MRNTRRSWARVRGFTLIELIVVMILIGVLAAVALPRLGDTGMNDRRLLDDTITALRFAQKTAVAAHRTTCATFSANSVTFRISSVYGAVDCTTGSVMKGADGNALTVSAIGTSSYAAFPASIVFDAGGAVATSQTVSVTGSGSLTVEAGTGYVH